MNELYSEFFEVFSKMECTLKQTGYLNRQNGLAKANWNKFADSVGKEIFASQNNNVKEALEYLKREPPLTQVVNNGKTNWEKIQEGHGTSHFGYYTDVIKKIRNNLFHGGKFNLNNGQNKIRNETLVKHALTILKECVKLNDEIQEIYNNVEW